VGCIAEGPLRVVSAAHLAYFGGRMGAPRRTDISAAFGAPVGVVFFAFANVALLLPFFSGVRGTLVVSEGPNMSHGEGRGRPLAHRDCLRPRREPLAVAAACQTVLRECDMPRRAFSFFRPLYSD
jgi:hypothetical protein